MEKRKLSNPIINEKRGITSDWHINQAKKLLEYSLEHGNQNTLIYSILESRLAIERYVFEMSVVVKGEKLTNKELDSAGKVNGVFKLLDLTMPNYRKHLMFSNLILQVNKIPISFKIPDLKKMKKLITKLSKYCHLSLTEKDNSELLHEWFCKAVALVEETIDQIQSSGVNGAMTFDSMKNEVVIVYNKFLREEISLNQARIQLELMLPVLKQRQVIANR